MIGNEKQTTLILACCGPCACALFLHGLQDKYDMAFLFYGNNFDSQEEYDRRLEALVRVNAELNNGKEMIIIPYTDLSDHAAAACAKCIERRLRITAEYTRQRGFDCFSTSLTVSPHKDMELINKLGSEIGEEFAVPFIELDLKRGGGFQKSVEISKRLNLYRQKHCGCKFSVRQ